MNITEIPDDVLSQIFLRLPVKSLICCKLVSKHWDSLISEPSFSLLRNPFPNPAVGLFINESEYISFSKNRHFPPNPELNIFPPDPAGTNIVQSSNGLFLCSSLLNLFRNQICYIYNPTTKTSLQLPALEVKFQTIQWLSLAFDPSKSPHYKVVSVFRRTNAYEFAIYSSKTRCWMKCAAPFTGNLVNFTKGVYWNGAIHWTGVKSDGCLYLNLENDDEMPRKLSLPPIKNGLDFRFRCYLGESCDHLHYIETSVVKFQFNVYEIKRDYSGWFVKYNVDLFPVVAAYPSMCMDGFDRTMCYPYGFSIFSLVRGVKEEDSSFLVLHIPGEIVRYNLVSGTFETIYKFENSENNVARGILRYAHTSGCEYIESLSSVDPDPDVLF